MTNCTHPTGWTVPDVVPYISTAIAGVVLWKDSTMFRVQATKKQKTHDMTVRQEKLIIMVGYMERRGTGETEPVRSMGTDLLVKKLYMEENKKKVG